MPTSSSSRLRTRPFSFWRNSIPSGERRVNITKGYWIDRFEVTNKAFAAFVDDGGYAKQAYWSVDG